MTLFWPKFNRGGVLGPPPSQISKINREISLKNSRNVKKMCISDFSRKMGGGRKTPHFLLNSAIFLGALLQIINDYPQLLPCLCSLHLTRQSLSTFFCCYLFNARCRFLLLTVCSSAFLVAP